MRKNMSKVIEAFREGRAADGDSKRTCRTDGKTVWSYAMEIAHKMSDGTIVIISYAIAPTRTTRQQVSALNAAFPLADIRDSLQER